MSIGPPAIFQQCLRCSGLKNIWDSKGKAEYCNDTKQDYQFRWRIWCSNSCVPKLMTRCKICVKSSLENIILYINSIAMQTLHLIFILLQFPLDERWRGVWPRQWPWDEGDWGSRLICVLHAQQHHGYPEAVPRHIRLLRLQRAGDVRL